MKKLLVFGIILMLLFNFSVTSYASYEKGTEQNPILITNQAELMAIEENPTRYYKLANDISLEGNWTPLCSLNDGFTGALDGNGYTISNLQINNFLTSGFIAINSGTIKNLNISTTIDDNYSTDDGICFSGKTVDEAQMGIVTAVNNGTISNCKTTGKISYYNNYYPPTGEPYDCAYYYLYLGGIAGTNNGTIVNSESNVELEFTAIKRSFKKTFGYGLAYVGGIAGKNNSIIEKCTSGNSVWGNGAYNIYSGGITGENTGIIKKCISDNNYYDNIKENLCFLGGIAGSNTEDASIDLCIAKGALLAINSNYYTGVAGGIAGKASGIINNSYFNGRLGGEITSGIVVDCFDIEINNCYVSVQETLSYGIAPPDEESTVNNCFYHHTVTEDNSTAFGTTKTSDEMKLQETYTDWNFDTIWGIDSNINNGYPYLLWEYEPTDNQITFDSETQTAKVYLNEAGTYTVIFADYDGTKFDAADIQPLTLKQGYNIIPTTLTLADGDKVLLWKDLTTLKPICESVNISSK